MAQPYIGEIRMFGGDFAPAGWALCNGQELAISENEDLFQLVGTTYGGDGEETFNLPDMQSRVPMHMGTGPDGNSYGAGLMAGAEAETLTVSQITAHTHGVIATTAAATSTGPANDVLGSTGSGDLVYTDALYPRGGLSPQAVAAAGGSQPHGNVQPFTGINFIISLFGTYPSPS